MIHLGDITKISGYEAPVVDTIIFGAPCQDLSVAGKRAGMRHTDMGDDETTRSGLFHEAVRIIKEMRDKDERINGRTGQSIRPRYGVYENVPGAFSSNKGCDFQIVLQELIKVAEPKAPDVPVPEKGWPTAGCIMGDNWSVAWRVLDAQFWGVPQRRRRIALVADFGGQSAPEILFIRQGVSRDLDESEQARKATARDAKNRTGAYDRIISLQWQAGAEANPCIGYDLAPSLSCTRVPAVGFPLGFRPENVRCYYETATTLCNGTRPGFTTGVIHPVIAVDQGGGKSGANFHNNLSPTLTCTHGGEPAVVYGIQDSMIGRADHNGPQGDGVNEDVSFTLNTTDRHAVVYGISPYHSNCMKSDNPHSGYYEADTARTLDALQCGYPGCNQGGMAVVETYQQVTGPLMANSHPGSYTGQDAYSDMLVAGPVQYVDTTHADDVVRIDSITAPLQARDYKGGKVVCIDRAYFNQGQNVQYEPQCYEDGTVPTLVAKGPSAVCVRYIVRRLTPLECERLQGFPDGWTDIGEWVDTNGKKHKAADSPRYKALGNSIALPPWKFVLKKLCACYEREATMASLFDGIGGFPLIWEQLNGKGSCLWASEIEEFPIAVTKLRFGESV